MMFHTDWLKQQFRDIARPNYFKVFIVPPKEARTDWDNNKILMCKASSLPSMEVDTIPFERAGMTLFIPSNKMTFGELTLTFYNDIDFVTLKMFQTWQIKCVNNWPDNYSTLLPTSLSGVVRVMQYDNSQTEVYNIVLRNCWPKTISEIQLSQDDENKLEEFNVTFAYSYYEVGK